MTLETKEEVLAFLDANRQIFSSRVGFKHLTEQLSDVITYIERLTEENEQLRSLVESRPDRA
jgi:hypothetical protein